MSCREELSDHRSFTTALYPDQGLGFQEEEEEIEEVEEEEEEEEEEQEVLRGDVSARRGHHSRTLH